MQDLAYNNYKIALGALLRALRMYRQKTIRQVAIETGISPPHISGYELGRRSAPTLVTLHKLCIALDYPMWKVIRKTDIRIEELGNEQSGIVSMGTK
jgi:transcriptional regulator with XRE-family HTH domain